MGSLVRLFVILLCTVTSAHADEEIAPSALIGTWTITSTHSSGAEISVVVLLTADSQFSNTTTVNGELFMENTGTWTIEGAELTWLYKTSTMEQPVPGTVDVDDIISVDEKLLILHSRLSGKQHEYSRVE